jgi:hypothetical protein
LLLPQPLRLLLRRAGLRSATTSTACCRLLLGPHIAGASSSRPAALRRTLLRLATGLRLLRVLHGCVRRRLLRLALLQLLLQPTAGRFIEPSCC